MDGRREEVVFAFLPHRAHLRLPGVVIVDGVDDGTGMSCPSVRMLQWVLYMVAMSAERDGSPPILVMKPCGSRSNSAPLIHGTCLRV